jgi:hypothetical protein
VWGSGHDENFDHTGNRNLQRQHHKKPEQLCYLEFISHRSCNRQQRLRHTRPSACDRLRFNRHRCNLRDCKWDSYADSYAVKRVICNLHWTGAGQCSRGDRCPTAFTNLQATGIRGCMTTTDPPSETSPPNLNLRCIERPVMESTVRYRCKGVKTLGAVSNYN